MSFEKHAAEAIPPQFMESYDVKDKDGNVSTLHYLSWAAAMGIADRPQQTVVTFGGKPFLAMLRGAAVAVDMLVGSRSQRTWLPILDRRNNAVPVESLTPRDISDTIARCRAKALAMVNGVGMCVYAGYEGNGAKFYKALGVSPGADFDPAKAQALASIKGKEKEKAKFKPKYLDWSAALSAARVTDPEFHWEVEFMESSDPITGEVSALPFMSVPGGYMVPVTVTWRGVSHTEFLPIMDERFQSVTEPDVADWNKAVMRCLAKAIAVRSGYGLSLYAGEDLTVLYDTEEDKAVISPMQAQEIEQMLKRAGKSEQRLLEFLNSSAESLAGITAKEFKRAMEALSPQPLRAAA
jgi:hypothetical protein